LHALVAELHEKAGAWELRPAWQMSSALALLVERVAAKTKDATPSALQTIAGCVDMLQEICVPGIRPNLLIDPPVKTMVVDDDPLCRRALQFALEKAGIEPDAASSGEQAVELAKAQAYDVVFMDIQMPGLDGLTACSFIRETEKNRDVPVIFVTVQSDFNTRAQSRLRGAADLMAKPFFVFEVTAKALMYAMRRRLRAAAAVSNRREVALVPEVAPSTAPAEAVAA
jgi:CheY-like chemotaxis protein